MGSRSDLFYLLCPDYQKKKKNHKTFITQNTKVRFKQKLDIEENLVVFSNEREIDSQYGIHFRKINFTTRQDKKNYFLNVQEVG